MEQLQTQQLTAMQRLKKNYTVNKPKYLQGAGYFGLGVTLFSGIYLGYKLPKAIDKPKAEINEDDKKYKKILKYLKHIAPVAAPAVVATTGTVVAFRGAYKEQTRRLAVVGAAYAGAVAELQTLKKKVEEVGGKKVAEKVKKAVQEEEVSKVEDPEAKKKYEEQQKISPDSQAYNGHDIPYYDPMLQHINPTKRECLVDAQYKMLAMLESEDEVDMTILYEALGYGIGNKDKPMPQFAYDYGWRADTVSERDYLRAQMPNAFFDIDGNTALTKDGIPCMYLEYYNLKPLFPEVR